MKRSLITLAFCGITSWVNVWYTSFINWAQWSSCTDWWVSNTWVSRSLNIEFRFFFLQTASWNAMIAFAERVDMHLLSRPSFFGVLSASVTIRKTLLAKRPPQFFLRVSAAFGLSSRSRHALASGQLSACLTLKLEDQLSADVVCYVEKGVVMESTCSFKQFKELAYFRHIAIASHLIVPYNRQLHILNFSTIGLSSIHVYSSSQISLISMQNRTKSRICFWADKSSGYEQAWETKVYWQKTGIAALTQKPREDR